MFNVLKSYMIEHKIRLEKCVNVCTDGSRRMTGKSQGWSFVSELAPSCSSRHCVLQ